MATNESAAETQSKASQASDSRRERSTISFPYLDLNNALEVARGVHAAGGKNCQQEQLAAQLGLEMGGSTFRVRLNTCRIFGLITYTSESVYLTDIGIRACDDRLEAGSKVDAFLAVPLYKRVYQEYRGTALPPLTALENALVNFGVAAKQAPPARQTFFRSAKQAGFFDADPKRLVLPSAKGRDATNDSGEALPHGVEPGGEENATTGTGGGDGGWGTQSPLLRGLIEKLPAPDAAWPVEQRKKWLTLAVNIFDNVYTGADGDEVTVTVSAVKGSAK